MHVWGKYWGRAEIIGPKCWSVGRRRNSTSPRCPTTSWIDRSRNKLIPMTRHTTNDPGSLRRRTEAVPVFSSASLTHSASSLSPNRSKAAGMSSSRIAATDSLRDMGPPFRWWSLHNDSLSSPLQILSAAPIITVSMRAAAQPRARLASQSRGIRKPIKIHYFRPI